MESSKYQWYGPGDVNAFFGLMLDNITGLVLTVTMLHGIFGFPIEFAIQYMIPGTAIGVFVGDLLFFGLAFRLARKEKRSNVTAMPLGLDTPSTIGMVLFVLGPAYVGELAVQAEAAGIVLSDIAEQMATGDAPVELVAQKEQAEFAAAMFTWKIGICAIFLSGVIKFAASLCSDWIRRIIPRAGLLGSLAAIALVLIAFNQLPNIAKDPIVGFASLVVVLIALVARVELPFKIPGALGAVGIGCLLGWTLFGVDQVAEIGLRPEVESIPLTLLPTGWFEVFSFGWLSSMVAAFEYLPYIIPFAIATVIGGIDCAESAAAAGDSYKTNQVIGIEALATLVAALFGGVIQTTPYIGHPAYKSMGGRAGYTLGTALFVGGAGVLGYFSILFKFIPEAALLPILIFIGLEITAQSFVATPRRHYTAIGIACMPALAKLVFIFLTPNAPVLISALSGGFIITSVVWAAGLASIVDRRFQRAALFFAAAGVLVLFGVMHSPLPGEKMFWPWNIGVVDAEGTVDPEMRLLVIQFAIAYFIMAGITFGLNKFSDAKPIESDEEFDAIAGH